jgi:hypothetical protein
MEASNFKEIIGLDGRTDGRMDGWMRRNALMENLEQRRGCELGESNKNLEEAWTGDARPWDWDFERR